MKKDQIVSAGYGFPFMGTSNQLFDQDPAHGIYYIKALLGPTYLKAEYVMRPSLTMALNFAFAQATVDQNNIPYMSSTGAALGNYYSDRTLYQTYSLLIKINYHFGYDRRFDSYIGLGLGYRYADNKYYHCVVDSQRHWRWQQTVRGKDIGLIFPFGFEFTLGLRYFIMPCIAPYLEVGLAKSPVQLGLSYRLNKRE